MKTKPIIMMKNCALTIPKAIREEQGLEPGDCFDLEVMPDGSLRLSRKECCHTPDFQPICKMAKKHMKQ